MNPEKKQKVIKVILRLTAVGAISAAMAAAIVGYIVNRDLPQYENNPNKIRNYIEYAEDMLSLETEIAWEKSADTLHHDAQYRQLVAQYDTGKFIDPKVEYALSEKIDSLASELRAAHMDAHRPQWDKYSTSLRDAYQNLAEAEKITHQRDSILSIPTDVRLKNNAHEMRLNYNASMAAIYKKLAAMHQRNIQQMQKTK